MPPPHPFFCALLWVDTYAIFELPETCLKVRLIDITVFYLPGSKSVCSKRSKDRRSDPCFKKRDFVKTHLGHVTKSDQYEAMKDFEQNVMNLADASDKGLLTGDRIVKKLRKRLNKVSKL